MDAKDILADAFGRLPDLVHTAVHDLTPEQLTWAPAPKGPGFGGGSAPEGPGFSVPSVGPGIGGGSAPEGPGFSVPSVGPGFGGGTVPEGPGFSVPSVGPGIGGGTASGANPIGWLVWHLTRVQDDHVADLMGAEQIYITGGWAPRFGLKPDPTDTGYGHGPGRVAAVAPESAQALEDYFALVNDRTLRFIDTLKPGDFDRVVDTAWDPPVTLGVRLVSVYDDDAQHAGQAAYLRGLL
jgi:hypothetical protein